MMIKGKDTDRDTIRDFYVTNNYRSTGLFFITYTKHLTFREHKMTLFATPMFLSSFVFFHEKVFLYHDTSVFLNKLFTYLIYI